ncbi:MAG: aminotransferase class I/II-fold pyridoxal phosphate-dependent enzyme [Nitriliruptorales bacterium]|nr:aminotransferase class I/II-fold pyridoxal phosphate-dependent enzyme [Nitriliruptorales bacterium]
MTDASAAVSARVRAVAESATLAIDAKAKALKTAGEDVIGFGAGEPDFATPTHIVEAAQAACADPAAHHYSPAGGQPALRSAIAGKTRRDSGLDVEPLEVLVTNGGKHALFNVFLALLDAGDDVLLPAPYWVSYPEQIRFAGGRPIELSTGVETSFRVSVEQLEQARTPRTKAMVFVSPSNPTGSVYPPEEIEVIGRWAAHHGIWVITDEIYEHLVYGDARHVSMPVVVPEVRERCVVVNGVAKTYAMTGWRVGWSIAPVPLTAAMARLQSHATSNVSNVAQAAALAAVSGPMDVVDVMRSTYDRRRKVAYERLNAIPGVSCALPQGAFYVFPSVAGVFGRSVGDRIVTTAHELCEALLDTVQVALVPGEGFGAPDGVRLSYALSDDDLVKGLDRIADALS